jgi:hypothetical protein
LVGSGIRTRERFDRSKSIVAREGCARNLRVLERRNSKKGFSVRNESDLERERESLFALTYNSVFSIFANSNRKR